MLYKIPKKQKKNLGNKKIPLWHHFKSKQVGKGREIEKIKIIIPFRSCPMRNRKLQKKIAKKFNKLKSTTMAHFKPKLVGKG